MSTAMGWFVHCLRNYAQFSGRASRPEYWWFYAAVAGVNLILIILSLILVPVAVLILSVIWNLGVVMPHLAVCSRRLHDAGRSFWWLAPAVGGYLILRVATRGHGTFLDAGGTFPALLLFWFSVWLGFAVTLLYFLCKPGDPGPNRYGDSAPTGPA